MDRHLAQESRPERRRRLIQALSLRSLLVVPVLLAIATALALFVHSDVNVALLFSQCHARARLHWLSRVPVLGPLSCFLVSFLGEALSSARAFAVMSVVLSFISSLLTVSTVEAARICNGPSILIAYPTGMWLVFNFMGGAVVWELVIIPAFFRRAKQLLFAAAAEEAEPNFANLEANRQPAEGEVAASAAASAATPLAAGPNAAAVLRHLAAVSEVAAIPTGVALGFVLPSVLMLVFDSPLTIVIWLFSPVYVSLIRQGVRRSIERIARQHGTLHLESHRPSLLAVYAVPVASSLLAHILLIWSILTQADDRKEMTRSTLSYIVIDVIFVGLTVLYWILVEAGWRVVLAVIAWSLIFGPGAGLCLGWIHRERQLGFAYETGQDAAAAQADDDGDALPGERTALLR